MKILVLIIFAIFCFGKCETAKTLPSSNNTDTTIYRTGTASQDGIGKFYMGREISQVMGAAGADWLERNSRNKEENTKLTIEKMALSPSQVVADIGAGTGYYTFKISQKVPQGKVYAVEIQEEMISYLTKRKLASGIANIEVIKGTNQSINLPDNSVDLAIMVDVYHELEFPHEILHAIKKSLKNSGKLLLLEYRAEDPSVQIKPLHKMSFNQVNKELQANGFKLSSKGDFLPIQHFLLYERNDD
jgi:ubiquinone/menaquinone biosynthesis C-methylase UbiE